MYNEIQFAFLGVRTIRNAYTHKKLKAAAIEGVSAVKVSVKNKILMK